MGKEIISERIKTKINYINLNIESNLSISQENKILNNTSNYNIIQRNLNHNKNTISTIYYYKRPIIYSKEKNE